MTDEYLVKLIQRSLQGNLPSHLVEVRFKNGNHLQFEFVFDGPISEDELETASCAETEILAGLYPEFTSESRFVETENASAGYQIGFSKYKIM
jgi:hypothetical protein